MRASAKAGILALGLVTVLAVVFGINQYHKAQAASLQMEAVRQRALFSLISHVENVEASMAKARAASTPGQQTALLLNCWSHSQAASESLSQLSMADTDLTAVRQFIARVGDYCQVLSHKASKGSQIAETEWQQLLALEDSVKDLARGLLDVGMRASLTGNASYKGVGLSRLLSTVRAISSPVQKANWLNDGFSEINTTTQSIPSPIYDGPFSDTNMAHATLASPGTIIDRAGAMSAAEGFLMAGDSFQSARVEENDGSIPCFLVTQKRADNSEVTTAVTKHGGLVLWATDSRRPGPTTTQEIEKARQKAVSFLESKGFPKMAETGWRKPPSDASRVVFAFVPVATLTEYGEVRLYPDLVKVEVGLDGGSVLSFDQSGYLTGTNQSSRKIPPPLVTQSEAKQVLRNDLKVQGDGKLAVIPLLAGREALAWEFQCVMGNDTYLVYINAMDGAEEAVFQFVSDGEGSLTV